ncbi:MAG: DEAD/DEAH box helicase [Kiritimatiellae bacterium]|nr:DEAD/DEAH box helicase [Kiritimatiellia bacterium]
MQNKACDNAVLSPFNVDAQHLKSLLTSILWSAPKELNALQLTINLPTATVKGRKYPLPSHTFLIKSKARTELNHPATSNLLPWRLDAIKLDLRQMIALFGACLKRRVAPGVFFDKDIYCLKNVYRFAGSLIARGQFLPSVCRASTGEYQALWQPVLMLRDSERLDQIIAGIPGVAVAGENLAESAEEFLNVIIDYIVRVSVMTTLSRAQASKGKFYSVHDAWLAALRGESPLIRWESGSELEELGSVLRTWRRPVEFSRESSITLMLKLHEPPRHDQKEWLLEVKYRQAQLESEFPAGAHIFTYPEISEHLLLSLGQAALLFSPLERIKRHRERTAAALTHQEAHTFINGTAALLRACGYEVELPAWCADKVVQPFALDAEILPHDAVEGSGEKDLERRFDLKWKVTLDGEPVTPEELEQLLKEQSSLVYFRERWIEIDIAQLQEALRIWRRKRIESRTAREIMGLALGGIQNPHGLDIRALTGQGWIETFLKTLQGKQEYEELPQPESFHGALRPYQARGFSWLVFLKNWGLGACLADDMGLGKTIQTIAFILHERSRGARKPILIVGPTSILSNWAHEIAKFAPSLASVTHHGLSRLRGDKLKAQAAQHDIVITSYTLLYKDYKDLRQIKWSGLIVDEAQNIKNSLTLQAQAARAITADFRIALTGTPMENNVGDIWSLMDFLNPGLLGNRKYFRDSFFKPIQSGADLKAKNRLRRITSPFILRRVKTDQDIIRDLPDKIENKIYCTLSLEQQELYRDVTDSFSREIEGKSGIGRRGAILAVLTHLKQICNHPANYLGESEDLENRSGKLDRLVEMLEEIFSKGESALIFTQYATMGALLKEHLCQTFAVDMPFLYGGTSRKNRDLMISGFQNSPDSNAFILSLKAGGTGLNLTRANHVFHYDRWWNPAVENQATDRAFRIGQKKNVMVHKFICAGTLEERIDALMSRKSQLTDEMISSNEQFLTELSNQKLCQLLQLSNTPLPQETIDE